jgi:hypothetical protein
LRPLVEIEPHRLTFEINFTSKIELFAFQIYSSFPDNQCF